MISAPNTGGSSDTLSVFLDEWFEVILTQNSVCRYVEIFRQLSHLYLRTLIPPRRCTVSGGRGAPVRLHRHRRLHDGATAVANVKPTQGGAQSSRRTSTGSGGFDRVDAARAVLTGTAAAAATTSVRCVRAFYFCTERYIRKMAERYIRKFYVIKYYILRISFASLVLF